MTDVAGIVASPDYETFRARLQGSNCDRCPALASGRRTIVVDRGNPSARLMIIGEAPGAHEDVAGRAFVGRGGQLLDRLMAEIGVDTNRDALIVNVLKCRPPDNRPPTPEEAVACRPFFAFQLATVRPRWVLLMGATAARHLFPAEAKIPMRDRVGRLVRHAEYPDASFMLTFHPAYLLRDPRQVPEAKKHLDALRAAMK